MRVRFFLAAVLAMLCALTSGCHHDQKVVRAAVASPPPPSAPPIQVPPPSVLKAQADSIAQQAPEPAPVEERPVEPPKPTRPATRRPAPASQQQPKPATQTASSGAPVADVIGQLSTGGDYSAEARKQAADFIDATQRRANSLSRQLIQAHRPAVDQIHDFLRKAQEALKSGDIDGATNLTTKAKVLLDDIQK